MIWLFLFLGLGLGLILLVFLGFRKKKPTIIFYEGSLGLGKTLLCVHEGIRLYKSNFRKWRRDFRKRKLYSRFHNIDIEYLEPPLLITNIELYLSKYGFAVRFNEDIIKSFIPFGSVLILDEVGSIPGLNQYASGKNSYNLVLDDFFRFFRQDTKGGFIVSNDQSFFNCNNVFRRRVNTLYKIDSFLKIWFLAVIKMRVFDVINDEEIPQKNKKGKILTKTKFLLLKGGVYNTHAHSQIAKNKEKIAKDSIVYSRPSNFNDNNNFISKSK